MLHAGAYEELGRLLAARRDTGGTDHVHILDAAAQLCLTCIELRGEQEHHGQATQRVAGLEEEIRRRIKRLLEPLWGGPAAPADGTDAAPPTRRQSLWRRVALTLRPPQPQPASPSVPTPTFAPPPPLPAPAPPPASTPERVPETEPAATDVAAVSAAAEPIMEPVQEPSPVFTIFCLGAFRVYGGERRIDNWPSRKGKSILQYMLLNRETPVGKDILMETFWPDGDPADTRRNLHQAIYSLRQSLRQNQPDLQPIIYKQDTYLLNPEVVLWIDFEEFGRHARTGREHEAAGRRERAMEAYKVAVSLYQGDFLEEDLYEDWPAARREELRDRFIDIANRLGEHYLRREEHTAAMALSRAILTKDNCHEEAHRRLMLCYAAIGQRHLAVRQYQTCVRALREELDLAPSEATTELYRTLAT